MFWYSDPCTVPRVKSTFSETALISNKMVVHLNSSKSLTQNNNLEKERRERGEIIKSETARRKGYQPHHNPTAPIPVERGMGRANIQETRRRVWSTRQNNTFFMSTTTWYTLIQMTEIVKQATNKQKHPAHSRSLRKCNKKTWAIHWL